MNIEFPPSFLVSVAYLGALLVPTYLVSCLFTRSTRSKKSPLSKLLLRSPGQSIRDEIEEVSTDIIINGLSIPFIILMIYAMELTNRYFRGEESIVAVAVSIVVGGSFCIHLMVKIYRQYSYRNKLRLGYECEVATGQELNDLIKYGYKVFHDFPADKFNIDHIAIGPQGVFAVETKGRSKQVKTENENWKMSFDGEVLKFPTWSETEPVAQARRQAKWLSQWLGSSTGTPQEVLPIVSLPGWHYTYTSKPKDVKIYNGLNPYNVVKGYPEVLSEERITAIVHQVEARCRDVKAVSYRKD